MSSGENKGHAEHRVRSRSMTSWCYYKALILAHSNLCYNSVMYCFVQLPVSIIKAKVPKCQRSIVSTLVCINECPCNQRLNAHALLDSGSDVSLMCSDITQCLLKCQSMFVVGKCLRLDLCNLTIKWETGRVQKQE